MHNQGWRKLRLIASHGGRTALISSGTTAVVYASPFASPSPNQASTRSAVDVTPSLVTPTAEAPSEGADVVLDVSKLRAEYRAWRSASSVHHGAARRRVPNLSPPHTGLARCLSIGCTSSSSPALRGGKRPSLLRAHHATPRCIPRDSRLLADFAALQLVGRGGFGVVIAATSRKEQKRFAIKVVPFREKQLPEVFAEVETMKALPVHPNLVRFDAYWIEDAEAGWPELLHEGDEVDDAASDTSRDSDSDCIGQAQNCETIRDSAVEETMGKLLGSGIGLGARDFVREVHLARDAGIAFTCSTGASQQLASARALCVQMELCELPTLHSILLLENTMIGSTAAVLDHTRWRWFEGLGAALQAMHGAGFVHHDVKPQNIFCCPTTGTVKLADFGCCQRMGTSPSRSGGTTLYAAPERRGWRLSSRPAASSALCSSQPASAVDTGPRPASDIFSLGVCAAEVWGRFRTAMERAKVVGALTGSGKTDELESPLLRCATAERLVRSMLLPNPDARPTAHAVQEAASALAKEAFTAVRAAGMSASSPA